MKLFEQKIVYLEDEATKIQGSSYAGIQVSAAALYEDALDSFGSEGWELVSVMTHPNPRYPEKHVPTAWFKRELIRSTDGPEFTLTPEDRVRKFMEDQTPPTTE